MAPKEWEIHNPNGSKRVVVTKELPGSRWLETLMQADCRVELCTSSDVLGIDDIKAAIGSQCNGVLGQLTEDWGDDLFAALKAAGGTAYSNVAVGYNNVDVDAATRHGIPVGNTPGVLTETTAQMAVALTFAAARRTGEAERFLRAGKYKGWLMTLFLGELLWRKTVGVIGAGRIGATYARMMVEGHKMNLIYHDLYPNKDLEDFIAAYSDFLTSHGEEPVSCRHAASLEEVLQVADCVSVHTVLDESTHHLINAGSLAMMKENAILVNTSRVAGQDSGHIAGRQAGHAFPGPAGGRRNVRDNNDIVQIDQSRLHLRFILEYIQTGPKIRMLLTVVHQRRLIYDRSPAGIN